MIYIWSCQVKLKAECNKRSQWYITCLWLKETFLLQKKLFFQKIYKFVFDQVKKLIWRLRNYLFWKCNSPPYSPRLQWLIKSVDQKTYILYWTTTTDTCSPTFKANQRTFCSMNLWAPAILAHASFYSF